MHDEANTAGAGRAAALSAEALARAVCERVFETFGVMLVPEPVTVGIAW